MSTSKPTDFAYHLTKYLSNYLPGQINVSSNTIMSYRDAFSLLLKFCKEQKELLPERLTIQNFSRELVEEFLIWMERERENSISTRNQRLASIHAFLNTYKLRLLNTCYSASIL